MFVDFDKVFNNKQQKSITVPDDFINYLNKKLPPGVRYIADEHGNCVITSNEDSTHFTLGGFKYILSSEDKKILGSNFSQKDILKLFYNRQASIPLQLEKEGYILVNGNEMQVSKLVVNPHNPIKYQSEQFFMSPPPFPDPFCLEVGTQSIKRNLLVQRIPHNSVNTIAFKSEDNKPLSINYTLNEDNNLFSMSISYNLKNSTSIRDILETAEIFNAFMDGNGYLGNHMIGGIVNTNNVKRFSKTSMLFWRKVLELEQCLNISFVVPTEDMSFETICLVEQLYQNLILKKPIKELGKPNTLDFRWTAENKPNLNDSLGKDVYFEFETSKTYELFGKQITLYGVTGIIGSIFSEVIDKGEICKIVLEDLHVNKPRYYASIFFKTENEMLDYKMNNQNERLTLFHNAKKASEYLTSEK